MPKKTNPHTQNDRLMVIRSDGDVNEAAGKDLYRNLGMLTPLGWGEQYPWGDAPPTAIYSPTRQGFPPVQIGAAYIYVDDPMPPDWNVDYVHHDMPETIDAALAGESGTPGLGAPNPKATRNRMVLVGGFLFMVAMILLVMMQNSCQGPVVS